MALIAPMLVSLFMTMPAGPASTRAESQVAASDSAATHAQVVLAISEFFIRWQRLWLESEASRASSPGRNEAVRVRLIYLHCHATKQLIPTSGRLPRERDISIRPFSQFPIVTSDRSEFAACPTWILGRDIADASDESEWRDGALISAVRSRAFDSRARLISTLDSAAQRWPGSMLLTGQLVRFHVDQRNFDAAALAARNCRAAQWWCLALEGYTMARRGTIVEADSLYAAMRASMSPTERCQWMDISNLLAPAEAANFRRMNCADRERAFATVWWLSDPLYRERGNGRLVTHETRRVGIALHRALDSDERFPWDERRGGDAMVRLIERYGWPTYTAWGGPWTDASHSQYLLGFSAAPVPPYTTFEYSLDRVARLMPSWSGATAPFFSRVSDWHLAGEQEDGTPDARWWPHEHVATIRRLVQLPEGQTALFRREAHVNLVTSHQLRHPLTPPSGVFDVMLLTTTSAHRIDSLDQHVARGGETSVLKSRIASQPQLVAIEAMGLDTLQLDARTRFGITPPATLSAMAPGDMAISDPALIDVRDGTAKMQIPSEALLDDLLGTTVLGAEQRRIGLYWESYGVAASDTVVVSVSLASDRDVGTLRRLGMALSVASDPTRALEIRWTEPSSQHSTRTLAGRVPIQMRSLVLNISQLAPGPYVLTVSIERPGRDLASSQRRVVVAP